MESFYIDPFTDMYRYLTFVYSGLKNCCNVWQFWSGCKVVLDRVRMMFSVGGVK